MLREIDTRLNAFEIYTIFKDEDDSFILDSAMDPKKLGRYSFISSNPFKKIKNSSRIATLNYLFFEILIGKNPIDIIETKSSSTIGKPVFGNSIVVKDCGCVKFSNFETIDF